MRHFESISGLRRSISTHCRGPDQIGPRRRGLGHGNGEFASVKRPRSNVRCRDGCRVYQVGPRRTVCVDRLIVGLRPSAWRPKMPKDVLPKFSKLDALSPYRPGSALLLCPKGMAPQPLHACRATRTLMMGRTSYGASGTHRGNSEQHGLDAPCDRKRAGILAATLATALATVLMMPSCYNKACRGHTSQG